MAVDVLRQGALFESYRAGQVGALALIVEAEAPYLYDYLLRMSGDVKRASETVSTLVDGALVVLRRRSWARLADLRLSLYATVRQAMAAHWHTNLGRLENQALRRGAVAGREGAGERRRLKAYVRLDSVMQSMPLQPREALLLHWRSRLTLSEIASLMQLSREGVERACAQGLEYLRDKVPGLPSGARGVVAKLPLHPMPTLEAHTSTDLVDVMRAVRRGQGRVGPIPRSQVVANSITVLVVLALLMRLGFRTDFMGIIWDWAMALSAFF